jgi:hypothetical protein
MTASPAGQLLNCQEEFNSIKRSVLQMSPRTAEGLSYRAISESVLIWLVDTAS